MEKTAVHFGCQRFFDSSKNLFSEITLFHVLFHKLNIGGQRIRQNLSAAGDPADGEPGGVLLCQGERDQVWVNDIPVQAACPDVVRLAGGYVSVCQHCEEPACVYACLKGIIQKEADGQVVRDFEHCIGCGACSVFCPTGAVIQDPVTEKYLTCDLCGGEPLCVKFCPTGELAYEEEAETSRRRREAYGEKIFADAKAPEPPAEIDWAELERRVKEVLS